LTLTHNATSLILHSNAHITTAANDRYEAQSLGGGNWIVTKYVYANGSVISATNATNATNATTTTPIKLQCRVSTTANITLSGGATNLLDTSVTTVAGDRILVTGQSNPIENGIYTVITPGTGSNGTWTRATDADGAGELLSGMLVSVSEGTKRNNSLWMLTTEDPITIGTTALTFARKDAGAVVVPDASTTVKGIVQLASTAEAQAWADNTKALTPLRLAEALVGGNQSLGTSGYQKLPGGLIIQWGYVSQSSAGQTVSFPITFPNALYSIQATIIGTGPGNGHKITAQSTASHQLNAYNTTGTAVTINYLYLAIGY
jgi:hypothetical protein